MELVGNALNGSYMRNLTKWADTSALTGISLAVAFVASMDELFTLAKKRSVPLRVWAVADGDFPYLPVMRRFLEGPPSWQMLLTRAFYHPKVMWFEGVGMYIGSANLTAAAWAANLECGVWFSQEEVLAEALDSRMRAMLDEVTKRSSPLDEAHFRAYERIAKRRKQLAVQQRALEGFVDAELAAVRGADKPIDPTAYGGLGGAAFVEEWRRGVSHLKKLTNEIKNHPWPTWVHPDANPAIVQDRATEYWYDQEVRSSGDAAGRIEKLYEQNRSDPDAAIRAVFDGWSRVERSEGRHEDVNVRPRRLHGLLTRESIAKLDEAGVVDLIVSTHAAHDYAKRASKDDLGDTGTASDEITRCHLLAKYLLGRRTKEGRDLRDVLLYVVWGDKETEDVGQRIWEATSDPKWRIRNLGPNMLGEMVGYARPEDYPPRNGRVSKVLRALGFEGVAV